MKQTVKDRLFLVFKLAVTLFVISPFYIAVIYSVKSKPEMVSNRLAFPKIIHWDILQGPLRPRASGWP